MYKYLKSENVLIKYRQIMQLKSSKCRPQNCRLIYDCQNHCFDRLLMGDDIETGKSTGSDYRAALHWLSEKKKKWR